MPERPFQLLGLDHVVLRVRDLPAMRAFYVDVLGCTVEVERPAIGLYQLRAGRSMIDLVPVDSVLGRRGGQPPSTEGHNLDHVCLTVDRFDDAALRAYLDGHGVRVGETGERNGAEGQGLSIYLTDPEGNHLELKASSTPRRG